MDHSPSVTHSGHILSSLVLPERRGDRKGEGMPQPQQPQWQPITMLQTIARHIDGMLQEAEEQQANVQQAQSKPWVLDDYTVKRIMEVFTVQEHDLWLFDTQLERWQTGTLTDRQLKEVERLTGQMHKLHAAIADILAMAAELSKGTIEKQMAKSDEQLGLEYLMSMFDGEEK